MLTEKTIKKLIEKGFKRWTKGTMDRLYINANDLGLECEYYNTGNIKAAKFNGDHISNSEAYRIKAAKTYIDVATGNLVGTYAPNTETAQNLIKEAETEIAEEEEKEETDEENQSESGVDNTKLVEFVEKVKSDPRMGTLPEDVRVERIRMFEDAASRATQDQVDRFCQCLDDNGRSACLKEIMRELKLLK